MNSTLCRTLRKMLADGFEQYNGVIDPAVYERLECPDPKKAYWVCNWPILHCLGCRERCTPKDIRGFQMTLPSPEPTVIKWQEKVNTLLKKRFVRPAEAAFCLDVSERHVRDLVDEGILVRHIRPPLRITAESVKAEMERLDN
ncbi:DNA-binding protein [Maridesulfovibrio sp.]|uniref:DNA-binding protein n=1 Tax=Maridesulfovibrio sp. TaxID=2795000 RepID=UPI002AA9557F|nr:DNA-binding protein [Maridesulfovibrio sp.]